MEQLPYTERYSKRSSRQGNLVPAIYAPLVTKQWGGTYVFVGIAVSTFVVDISAEQ
jgi:hypothetical protein